MNKLINNCYRGRTHSWFCTYIITHLERQMVSPAKLSYVLWVMSSSFNLAYIFLTSFTFLNIVRLKINFDHKISSILYIIIL